MDVLTISGWSLAFWLNVCEGCNLHSLVPVMVRKYVLWYKQWLKNPKKYVTSGYYWVVQVTKYKCRWIYNPIGWIKKRVTKKTRVNLEGGILMLFNHIQLAVCSQIAKFMRPTWGAPGSCRPQVDPLLAPQTLLSGLCLDVYTTS